MSGKLALAPRQPRPRRLQARGPPEPHPDARVAPISSLSRRGRWPRARARRAQRLGLGLGLHLYCWCVVGRLEARRDVDLWAPRGAGARRWGGAG